MSASLSLRSSSSTASLFMNSLLLDPLYQAIPTMTMYTMKIPKMIPPPSSKDSVPPLFLMMTPLSYHTKLREDVEADDQAVSAQNQADQLQPDHDLAFRVDVLVPA